MTGSLDNEVGAGVPEMFCFVSGVTEAGATGVPEMSLSDVVSAGAVATLSEVSAAWFLPFGGDFLVPIFFFFFFFYSFRFQY